MMVMTPAEYLTIVVLPTVSEFKASPGDIRLAYTACILAYHLADYIAGAEDVQRPVVYERGKAASGAAWAVVHEICNATKHGSADPGKHFPGEETLVPPFAFDEPSSGWGVNRLEVPGLATKHGDIEGFLDQAVREFILSLASLYPKYLGSVDLRGL